MPPKNVTAAELAERQRVGATLKTFRRKSGWELGPFATELGISYSYLSNIEAGRKPLTDILLARAARLLDVEQIAIKRPTLDDLQDVPA
jgi:transcriptional regulator with XRE-family HTH domain